MFATRHRRLSGFTLIELLVVVAIVGILAAIMLPKIGQAITTAKQGRTVARLNLIRSASNMYFVDHTNASDLSAGNVQNFGRDYPLWLGQIQRIDENGAVVGCFAHTVTPNFTHPYIETIPAEEVGNGPQVGTAVMDWCVTNHSYHLSRTVSGGAAKGGWVWCIPNGAGAPTGAASGTVWIDEDGMMFGGKSANNY